MLTECTVQCTNKWSTVERFLNDKFWKITKAPIHMKILCNDVHVSVLDFSFLTDCFKDCNRAANFWVFCLTQLLVTRPHLPFLCKIKVLNFLSMSSLGSNIKSCHCAVISRHYTTLYCIVLLHCTVSNLSPY